MTMNLGKFVLRRDCRRGYVLLVTLVLLSLSALALASMSRAALARMQAAAEAQTQLQRRWGVLSCQAILLPKTELLLHNIEVQTQRPTWSFRRRLQLGEQQFDIVFGDESAKANVTTLVQRQGKEQAELTIRRLSLASAAAGNVHLRSRDDFADPKCFGDVFKSAKPAELCDCPTGTSPAELLSCWGDGRLDIHRASETVLKEACTGILNLTQVHLLVQLQTSHPNIDLASALKQLQLNQANYAMAQWALSDGSNCHSLWVRCSTQRASYWSLAVADQSQSMVPKIWHFEW